MSTKMFSEKTRVFPGQKKILIALEIELIETLKNLLNFSDDYYTPFYHWLLYKYTYQTNLNCFLFSTFRRAKYSNLNCFYFCFYFFKFLILSKTRDFVLIFQEKNFFVTFEIFKLFNFLYLYFPETSLIIKTFILHEMFSICSRK